MQSHQPTPRVYRLKHLRERGIDWSRKHLRSLELAGKFPRHFALGLNSIGWNAEQIDEWLRARIRGDGPAAKKAPVPKEKREDAPEAQPAG